MTFTHIRRQRFAIVIVLGLWGRIEVSVEPRIATHPTKAFRNEAEALEFARQLSRTEGLPVHDARVPPPEAA